MINASSFEVGVEIGVRSCVLTCVISERLVEAFAIHYAFPPR
jgi:hypothetical protein